MSDYDSINNSFYAYRTLKRDIDALVYLANLIPDEDEHHSLISILADRLDSNACMLHRELCPLWANLVSIDSANDSEGGMGDAPMIDAVQPSPC